MKPILLASSSVYRRQLLQKLHVPFEFASPDIDETPLPQEPPQTLTLRLAEAKARAFIESHPNHLIIGSDQVCSLDNLIFGKPHTPERALDQLTLFSGRRVTFYTGLCLLDSATGLSRTLCEPYHIQFRNNTHEQIQQYINKEHPLDCAGSIKTEGLGITLIETFEGKDPNTLIGLPLISLTSLLREANYDPLIADHSSN